MPTKQPLVIDHTDWPKFLLSPPLLISFQSGWMECIHCYLEPTTLAQIADEPMNLECVELLLTLSDSSSVNSSKNSLEK